MAKISDAKYMVVESPKSKMKTIVNTETKTQATVMWFSDVDAIYDDVAKVFIATVGFNFVNLKTGKLLFPNDWFEDAQLWDYEAQFTGQVFYKGTWIEIDKDTTIEDLEEQVEIHHNGGKVIEISLPANCEIDISEDKRKIEIIVK